MIRGLPVQPDRYDIERRRLLDLSIEEIAANAGASLIEKQSNTDYRLSVPLFSNTCILAMPDGAMETSDGEPVSYPMNLFLLSYLCTCSPEGPRGRWVDYGSLPDGMFISAKLPASFRTLGERFGASESSLQEFRKACLSLGGVKSSYGDASFVIMVFPKISVLVIIHLGDDEFAPAAKIVVDEAITSFLNIEFTISLLSVIVGILVKQGRDEHQQQRQVPMKYWRWDDACEGWM